LQNVTFSPSSPADIYSPLVPERRVLAPVGQMGNIASQNGTSNIATKACFQIDARKWLSHWLRAPSCQ